MATVAVGRRGAIVARGTTDKALLGAFLERPAKRSQERGRLAGRRKHGALDAQRSRVLAIEAQIEPERGDEKRAEPPVGSVGLGPIT